MVLDVMKDFKAQRIDTIGVIARVKDLLKGTTNLSLVLTPSCSRVMKLLSLKRKKPHQKRTVQFEEAISFVNKIKTHLHDDEHVYKSFLDILNMYRKKHKGITEVYREVVALFINQPGFLDEFTKNSVRNNGNKEVPTAAKLALEKAKEYKKNQGVLGDDEGAAAEGIQTVASILCTM